MTSPQNRLIQHSLAIQALRFGSFTLKSGRQSPYFFNAGLFNTGDSLKLLGECYAETLLESGLEFDMIFGPAYKGIPLVATTAVALSHQGRNVPYCFNRKEAKDHGEGGSLVGAALQGKVVIVDDVISAGTAMRESVEIIQQAGAQVAGIVIALNRQERGQGALSAVDELSTQLNIPVFSVMTLEDLIRFSQDNLDLKAHYEALMAYRQEYGA